MKEISRQTLVEVCDKLGIDPDNCSGFSVQVATGGQTVEVTVTHTARVFERMEHDPF